MNDNYRHKGMRQQLVKQLVEKGISDTRILQAIMEIPRHYFLDKAFSDWAYKDVAFPIDADQTISQPYTVAFQTELLKVKKGDTILEIGTGSGYQACVLAFLQAKVYTIERQKTLYDKTTKFLADIGYNQIRSLYGDGYLGAPRFAPFDKILVTAGAPTFPIKLFEQLKPKGIMILPLGEGETQTMMRYTKNEDGSMLSETFGNFRFVPFLNGISEVPNNIRPKSIPQAENKKNVVFLN